MSPSSRAYTEIRKTSTSKGKHISFGGSPIKGSPKFVEKSSEKRVGGRKMAKSGIRNMFGGGRSASQISGVSSNTS